MYIYMYIRFTYTLDSDFGQDICEGTDIWELFFCASMCRWKERWVFFFFFVCPASCALSAREDICRWKEPVCLIFSFFVCEQHHALSRQERICADENNAGRFESRNPLRYCACHCWKLSHPLLPRLLQGKKITRFFQLITLIIMIIIKGGDP